MSLFRETNVKATRKLTTCDCCLKHIDVGSSAVRVVGTNEDGEFIASTMHHECRAAELRLNDVHDTMSGEWIGLSEAEPDDREWLVAEHPIAAARIGFSA